MPRGSRKTYQEIPGNKVDKFPFPRITLDAGQQDCRTLDPVDQATFLPARAERIQGTKLSHLPLNEEIAREGQRKLYEEGIQSCMLSMHMFRMKLVICNSEMKREGQELLERNGVENNNKQEAQPEVDNHEDVLENDYDREFWIKVGMIEC